jgi:hypothetical protein
MRQPRLVRCYRSLPKLAHVPPDRGTRLCAKMAACDGGKEGHGEYRLVFYPLPDSMMV